MSLSREAIVDQLKEIVGVDRVITDETVLKRNSIDRFRKYADIHGVFTLPLPAAVVKLGSTEQVSNVLAFMNQHKINGVPRTGASATEGGLETVVENSVVLDGAGMNQILNIDIENMQATAQCGVPLEVLENALRAKGYTTGHSPQSKPLAQMGGWWQPAALASSPRCTAQLKIWLSGLRPCWRTVPSPASKTSRAAPPGRTFAISSSATKVHCAISLK
jgi:hypothetical protein